MKLLFAIVHHEHLTAIQEALDRHVACLMAVTPVQAHGPEPSLEGSFRGTPYRIRRSRLRLEIALDDEFVDAAGRAIASAVTPDEDDPTTSCTMFVVPVDEFEPIRLRG